MLRRLLPQSLLGQMLLAVAAALLLAQFASAVLLYRASEDRREVAAITGAAFQLMDGQSRAERGETGLERTGRGDRRGRRGEWRGERRGGDGQARSGLPRALRYQVSETAPVSYPETRGEGEREAFLRELLSRQGVEPHVAMVAIRQAGEDPALVAFAAQRPRFARHTDWQQRRLLVAAIQMRPGGEWQVARIMEPPRREGALGAIIVQTLVIFVVVLLILWLMLRRITRPLAALTSRVERFDGSTVADQPLAPSGPDDTRRLIAAHNAMEARITALLDEKDVMLGAIGHDLKTPLAALRVRIESVEDEAERARMVSVIEDITTSLDDILSLARVGRPTDPVERTDLAALVASVVGEYEDMGEDVELVEAERVALSLRATWLRRAVRNLVSNALRYGEQARVRVGVENGHAVIRVADTGPGIPEAELARMLEPFARGESSRNRSTGGAGLGLTLARAIAEQHGGTLTLANRMDGTGKVAGLVAEIRVPVKGAASG